MFAVTDAEAEDAMAAVGAAAAEDMLVDWECGARFRKLMTFRLVWCCCRGGGVTWCNEFACGFSSLNDYLRILAMPLAFVHV